MSLPSTAEAELVTALVAQRRPGWGLPRPLYLEPAVYRAEMQAIWRRGWLFAGHAAEIPHPGDFFVYEVDGDAVIVARQTDGGLAAFHNVCRHRGSLVVEAAAGHAHSFICPYHQWTYGLDGRLRTCRDMPADLDKGALGLQPVAVRHLVGLIYICLAAEPPDFDAAAAVMAPLARPQGLERARVAHRVDYDVPANWKLVWENNRECYHCDANHPQYVLANFDRYDAGHLSAAVSAQLAAATARSEARWAAGGLAATHTAAGLYPFPDAEQGVWYSANRTVLAEGYVTESLDGAPVAPLMGDYPDPDVGTLRLRTLPNFWSHASGDHAVTTRLTPVGPSLTRVSVWWLVAETAQAGRDYTLERLLPFWQLTSEQDWAICARQQRGVGSQAYLPGPLSPAKEYNVEQFLKWYAQSLAAELGGGGARAARRTADQGRAAE